MQSALKGTELTTVLLQPGELQWLKPEKEIWLNESFFDVLSIDSSSVPWKVEGLYDPEDTRLHMKLIRLLHKEDEQEDNSLRSISGWWAVWCALPWQMHFTFPPLSGNERPVANYSGMLLIGLHNTPSPPPWTC